MIGSWLSKIIVPQSAICGVPDFVEVSTQVTLNFSFRVYVESFALEVIRKLFADFVYLCHVTLQRLVLYWHLISGSGLIPAVEDDSTVRSDEGRIQEDRTSFDSLMGAGDGSFHRYCLLRRRREASDGFGTIFMVAA